MTFNDNADISKGRVSRRAKTGFALGGGGGVIGIIVLIVALTGGPDLTGLVGGLGGSGTGDDTEVSCETGEQANESVDCRMDGAYASLDDYWAGQVDGYRSPAAFILFEGSVGTGCGTASSAVGPFYCPADESIYIDTGFFDELSSRYGASTGNLTQLYVVAHEWGHHIQNLIGAMEGLDNTDTGPGSDAVRLELQADCFAGAWVGAAEQTVDDNGTPYLTVTDQDVADALSAAEAIGDDRIQEQAQGQVNPESWTHGSGEQRQRWFEVGRTEGPTACTTFEVPASEL